MRIAFLPNWCKYLSLALFIASFITGIYDFRKGFEEGGISMQRAMSNNTNSIAQSSSTTYIEESKEEKVTLMGYLSDVLIMLSMIVYILSKDKNDDEYINVIRGKSLMIALLIGVVTCFIAYGFGCHIQGIWLLLVQFLSYMIIFKISKIAANPWVKADDKD